MKFIQYPDQDFWWEWNTERMEAYNYNGGHHSINENGLGDCKYIEAKDWHDLYLKTGYNPMECDVYERDVWISPEGVYYYGDAHAVQAEHICEIIYGQWFSIDYADAKRVIKHLGIRSFECNIKVTYDAALEEVGWATMAFRSSITEQTKINLAPRIRMSLLYAVSQSINGRVVCTDNLSESFIGYSTRWGDNVGDFAPLAWFTSDEVVAIGDELGLPYELTHKTPADGLCGKTDEDNFGFTYEQLNTYIRTGKCDDDAVKEKIEGLYEKNVFKLNPIPKFVPYF